MKESLVKNAVSYIKATTAFGGQEFSEVSGGFTPQNEDDFGLWLEEQPKVSDIVLYRGYTFDSGYYDDCFFRVGLTIGEAQLTQAESYPAFTDSMMRGAMYMNEFGAGIGMDSCQRVLFKVNTKGVSFVDVSMYSTYPCENEYRCKRDVRLRVVRVIEKGGYVEVVCTEEI